MQHSSGVSNVIHTNDILDTDRFWKEELMRVNADRAFACSIYQSQSHNVAVCDCRLTNTPQSPVLMALTLRLMAL